MIPKLITISRHNINFRVDYRNNYLNILFICELPGKSTLKSF